jgi:hypothetical protein
MLKKHMAACLVATAFVAAPALAQTSPAPATSPPAASAPATSAPATSAPMASSASSGKFMQSMEADQWRSSKLVGTVLYGANNERIGEVNEIILSKTGQAEAVVVGVGGFLGIGEKNVAVPFSSVEWTYGDRDVSTTAATRTDVAAPRTANPPATGTTATTPPASGTTAAARDNNRGDPDRGILRMTKAELEAAPRFAYNPSDADRNQTRTTAPATNTAPATAPKQ